MTASALALRGKLPPPVGGIVRSSEKAPLVLDVQLLEGKQITARGIMRIKSETAKFRRKMQNVSKFKFTNTAKIYEMQ